MLVSRLECPFDTFVRFLVGHLVDPQTELGDRVAVCQLIIVSSCTRNCHETAYLHSLSETVDHLYRRHVESIAEKMRNIGGLPLCWNQLTARDVMLSSTVHIRISGPGLAHFL